MISQLKQLDNLNSGQYNDQEELSKMKVPTVHDIKIDDDTGNITIDSVNIDSFEIKYYLIDAEVLFSNSPYVEEQVESFSYVVPFTQINLNTKKDSNISQVVLPKILEKKNIVIEVKSNHS